MTNNTLTKSKSSRSRFSFIGGDQNIGFEAAAIVASASPLSIISMGTFPSSLVALGRIRHRDFDDDVTLQPKRNPVDEDSDLCTSSR